jgi:hypothetical protein
VTAGRGTTEWYAVAVLAVLLAFGVSGCATRTSELQSVLGTPEGVPAKPETPPEFPHVHDVPPQRQQAVLSGDEQARIERDLVLARERQIPRSTPAARRAPKSEE